MGRIGLRIGEVKSGCDHVKKLFEMDPSQVGSRLGQVESGPYQTKTN